MTGLQMSRSRNRPTAAARKLGPHALEENAEKWAYARIAKAADLALSGADPLERQRLARAIEDEKLKLERLAHSRLAARR